MYPIVEACVFRGRHGWKGLPAHSGGLELTKRVNYIPSGPGCHKISIPVQQNDIDEDSIKVIQKIGTFELLHITLDKKYESLRDKAVRNEQTASLHKRLQELQQQKAEKCLHMQTLTTLKLNTMDVVHSARRNFVEASKDAQTYLDHLGVISEGKLGDKALIYLEEEMYKLQGDIRELENKLIVIDKKLREILSLPPLILMEGAIYKNDIPTEYESFVKSTVLLLNQVQWIIQVDIETADEKPLEFAVQYFTSQGCWMPRYKFNISTANLNVLDVSYYADVWQRTSEPWSSVDLTLSTCELASASTPPHFGVCVVRPEEPKMMARVASKQHVRLMAAPEVSETRISPMMDVNAASCGYEHRIIAKPSDRTNLQASYKVPLKVSVDPDCDKPSEFLIGRRTLTMKSFHLCHPEQDARVYTVCRVTNSTDYHFVESDLCAITRDNVYTTSTSITSVPPQGKFNVFMGQSENIKLTVRPAKQWNKSGGGFLAQNDKLYYERSVTVESSEPNAVLIFFVFNLIEPGDESIKINLDKVAQVLDICAPDDISVVDSDKFPELVKGEIQWIMNSVTHNCICVVNLEPKGTKTISFSIVLESPNGKAVTISDMPLSQMMA